MRPLLSVPTAMMMICCCGPIKRGHTPIYLEKNNDENQRLCAAAIAALAGRGDV